MRETWKRVSSIGLVVVLMATLLMSFPLISAKPPGACEPWPECKDGGEEPPADPAIAYRVGDNKIMVMNADGSNQAVVFEMEDFSITGGASWSPDGKSIAWSGYTYIPNVPGWHFGVWRIDVEIVDGVPQGSNLQQLVNVEGDSEFLTSTAWSPLGNEIAYTVHTWYTTDIYKIDAVSATGGTPYNIYTAPEGHGLAISNGLAWSSDGTQIAVCGGELSAGYDGMSIMIIERATANVTHRLLTGQFHFRELDWARQGSNKLAFHDEGGSGMIYTVDIDTETVVPVVEGGSPSWSPDNSKIVYLQPLPGKMKWSTSTYEFSTGDITPLTKGGVRPDWRR